MYLPKVHPTLVRAAKGYLCHTGLRSLGKPLICLFCLNESKGHIVGVQRRLIFAGMQFIVHSFLDIMKLLK